MKTVRKGALVKNRFNYRPKEVSKIRLNTNDGKSWRTVKDENKSVEK